MGGVGWGGGGEQVKVYSRAAGVVPTDAGPADENCKVQRRSAGPPVIGRLGSARLGSSGLRWRGNLQHTKAEQALVQRQDKRTS